jgi:hypothetical protein
VTDALEVGARLARSCDAEAVLDHGLVYLRRPDGGHLPVRLRDDGMRVVVRVLTPAGKVRRRWHRMAEAFGPTLLTEIAAEVRQAAVAEVDADAEYARKERARLRNQRAVAALQEEIAGTHAHRVVMKATSTGVLVQLADLTPDEARAVWEAVKEIVA